VKKIYTKLKVTSRAEFMLTPLALEALLLGWAVPAAGITPATRTETP